MKALRWTSIFSAALCCAAGMLSSVQPAFASCDCRCIDGQAQAVCSSSLEVPPLCSGQSCPVSPSMTPVAPLGGAVGDSICDTVQVFNPRTRRYESRQACR